MAFQNFTTHNHNHALAAWARLPHRDRGQGRVGGSRVTEWVLIQLAVSMGGIQPSPVTAILNVRQHPTVL